MEIQLPETELKLVVPDGTSMFIRAVQVIAGLPELALHLCEARNLPLYEGAAGQSAQEVNNLRLATAVAYIQRCGVELSAHTTIRTIKLFLAATPDAWHAPWVVIIQGRKAELQVCNPSFPTNAIVNLMGIQSA